MKRIAAIVVIATFSLALGFAKQLNTPSRKNPARPGNEGNNADAATIRAYCVEIQRFTEKYKADARVFAETWAGPAGDSGAGRAEWREFKTEKEWKEWTDSHEVGDAAFVWFRSGKLIAANFTRQSESGDWVSYENSCFREDGILAQLYATLNTFNGEMTVVRERIYSPRGKLINSKTSFLDLKTKKPKNRSAEFYDHKPVIYLRANKLPFAKLLELGR